MRKFLLLTGIFTAFTFNTANAQRYYEKGRYYTEETPQHIRAYQGPRAYSGEQMQSQQYVQERRQAPASQYRQLTNTEERHYQEKQSIKENQPTNTIRPYIGFDVMTTSTNFGFGKNQDNDLLMKDPDFGYEKFKDKNIAGSLIAGIRVNKNWGVEAFYQKSNEEEANYPYTEEASGSLYSENITDKISFKAYGVDAQYYLPVTQEFELLASLGLAQYDFSAKEHCSAKLIDSFNNVYTDNEQFKKDFDSIGIRLGIGGQYYLTENLALRAMARYIKMNDDDYIKSLTEFSLGLRYMF